MQKLKQGVGGVLRIYIVADDHVTPVVGLVTGDFTVKQLAKAGTNFAALTLVITSRGYGHYDVTLDGTDCSDDGATSLHLEGVGIDPVDVIFDVVTLFDEDITTAIDTIGDMVEALDTAVVAHRGTAQAGGAASITLDTGASAVNLIYRGMTVAIVAGTGAGQARILISYTGASRVGTTQTGWDVVPDNTSEFVVVQTTSQVEMYNLNSNITALITTLTGHLVVRASTCQNVVGGTGYTFKLDAGASATNTIYRGLTMRIISGTGAGQVREVASYGGSSKEGEATTPWTVVPDNTSTYVLLSATAGPATALETLANSLPDSTEIAGAVWLAALADNAEDGSVGQALRLALGLAQSNYMLDETTYSGADLTNGRIRLFADAAGVAAATDGGTFGAEDEIAGYTITAVFEAAGKVGSYKVAKL